MSSSEWQPAWEPDKQSVSPACARVLSGTTGRYFLGGFASPLFVRRVDLFDFQRIRRKSDATYRLQTMFYERLRSVDELVRAAGMLNSAAWAFDGGVGLFLELCLEIFPSVYDAPNGAVPMPDSSESSVGCHSVLVTMISAGRVGFVHAWPGWGVDGAADSLAQGGTFQLKYVERYFREAWAIRLTPGPDPDSRTTVSGGHPGSSIAQVHSEGANDGRWTPLGRTPEFDMIGCWMEGVGSGQPWLQCLAIAHSPAGDPTIVGWLHGRVDGSAVDIEELFVWPPYRGRKIGAALAGSALYWASNRGYRQVRWLELQSDAVERSYSARVLPNWLRRMDWHESDQLGIRSATDRIDLTACLLEFENLEVPGGLRRVRAHVDNQVLTGLIPCDVPGAPMIILGIHPPDYCHGDHRLCRIERTEVRRPQKR
jgi:GNAT superfamily N-acetyltransferase